METILQITKYILMIKLLKQTAPQYKKTFSLPLNFTLPKTSINFPKSTLVIIDRIIVKQIPIISRMCLKFISNNLPENLVFFTQIHLSFDKIVT